MEIRVLLTGFDPFDYQAVNPALEVVKQLIVKSCIRVDTQFKFTRDRCQPFLESVLRKCCGMCTSVNPMW